MRTPQPDLVTCDECQAVIEDGKGIELWMQGTDDDDSILATVSYRGQVGDFCSQVCVTKYLMHQLNREGWIVW